MDDVAKFPGLMTRKGSRKWYYRATIPRGLRDLYGKAQIWVSLGTEDRTEAERAWYEVSAKWRDDFERKQFELDNPGVRVRRRPRTRQQRLRRARHEALKSGTLLPLTRSAATELARRWYRNRLADRWLGTPDEINEAITDAWANLAVLSDPDDEGTLIATQDAAISILTEHGFDGDVGNDTFDYLTELLRQAMLELQRLHLERLETGDDRATRASLFGSHEIFDHGHPVRPSLNPKPLREALNQYAKQSELSRSTSEGEQASKIKARHEAIRAHFGDDFDTSLMRAPDVEGFMRLVSRLPANRSKKYPGLSIIDAIEAGERDEQKQISDRVRADYFRELKHFVRWCRRNEIIANDPFELIDPPRPRPEGKTKRSPYSIDELKRLFNAPLYTGCRNDEYGFNKPGPERPRRGRFWLPLLGLFTGARAGELCQLRVEDVRWTSEGTPYLAIRKDEDGMSLKSASAFRDIPIHSELVKIGFLNFVEQQRQSTEPRLFPEMLIPGEKPSYRFSKLYGTFKRAVGVKRSDVNFHSFRHTARQALRRSDLFKKAGHSADEQIDDVFGWSSGKSMASRYGDDYPVEELATFVALINYPGLDLSHLYLTPL